MQSKLFLLLFLFVICIQFSSCSKDETITEIDLEQYIDETYNYDPNDFYYTAQPLDWENYSYAEFGLHLPDSMDRIKGILVLVNGHNGNGMNFKNDPAWREFANRNNLAIVGCYIVGNHYDKRYYLAGGGSGYALITAINNFADQTGIDDLRTLPLALWGYSDGAIFAYTLTCNIPYRVAAFVSDKGGYFPFIADDATTKVPGFLIYGENDTTRKAESINVFNYYRPQNALWLLLNHRNNGHELGNELSIARSYIEQACAERIDPVSHELISLSEGNGFLSSASDREYWAYPDYPHNEDYAGWLPNESFAVIWKTFVELF